MDKNRSHNGSLRNALALSGKGLVFLAVGLLLVGWLLSVPPGLLGKADAVGYAVCHRIDLRSFHLGDRPLPLCSRCTGMYLGALLGLAFQELASGRRAGLPSRRLMILLAVLAFAFAVDGLNSYLHLFPGAPSLYEPTNTMRLVTGTGMGLVVALFIYPAFNQSVWKAYDPSPALSGWRPVISLLLLSLAIDWLVWIQNPFLLFLFGLISALGVMVLLTMVYTIFWLMLLKQENRSQRWSQLLLPLAMGFGTAMAQIAVLDLIRFALTGTWDGFHLG